MSEPIKVGDLVQVVRGRSCCGFMAKGDAGHIFKVTEFRSHTGTCRKCEIESSGTVAIGSPHGFSYFIYRLKRIPPLEELEREKCDEEITA